MRIIVLLLSGFIFVSGSGAQAQDFSSYTYSQFLGCCNGPGPTGAPLPTDVVAVNRFNPATNTFSTSGLPLSAFASAADIQNLNGKIAATTQATNARIDQAFQAINSNTAQLDRGVAAAVALPSAFMPSAPGRTSWAVNAATFDGNVGGGFSLTHRLNFSVPIAVTASYGYGGGSANVARLGLMGEF
jgi:hypothetical protein